MAQDPFVFAMANPDPEVSPEAALPYAGVMATGRSHYPNQMVHTRPEPPSGAGGSGIEDAPAGGQEPPIGAEPTSAA